MRKQFGLCVRLCKLWWWGEGPKKIEKGKSTQDKSIAQLSVCARLCTIACLLCKLRAFPSFSISLGDTTFTCVHYHKQISNTSKIPVRHFIKHLDYNRMKLFNTYIDSREGRSGTAISTESSYGRIMWPCSHLFAISSPSLAFSNGSPVCSTLSAASTKVSPLLQLISLSSLPSLNFKYDEMEKVQNFQAILVKVSVSEQ